MGLVRIVGLAVLLSVGLPPGVGAQATMTYDHVHLMVPEPEKAVAWYAAHLEGMQGARTERVYYGGTHGIMVAFLPMPAVGPSAGTVMDHFALSVANLDITLRKLQDAGARILEPVRPSAEQVPSAVIQDPWGTKVELLEDPAVQGFDHMHLRVTNVADAKRWFSMMFGGEPGTWRGHEGIRYGTAWLLFDGAGDKLVPLQPVTGRWGSKESISGYAIDHIGWRLEDLDTLQAKLEELRAQGVKILSEQSKPDGTTDGVFVVGGPDDIRIEIVVRRRW